MKIVIEAEPNEVAALVLKLQERHSTCKMVAIPLRDIEEAILQNPLAKGNPIYQCKSEFGL